MKNLMIIILLFCMTSKAESEIMVGKQIKQRVCELVVEETTQPDSYSYVSGYSVKDCMKNVELNISQRYPYEVEKYSIYINDSSALSLLDTEQWVACEFEVNGPLKRKNIQLLWCSIEG